MKITRHADKRLRKRTGVKRSAVTKMARKALDEGFTRQDFSGSLRRYLDALYHYNGSANNIRVWGEKVWIFSDYTLVTVLDLPRKYRARANGIAKKDSADD